jgi:hypothetical protein
MGCVNAAQKLGIVFNFSFFLYFSKFEKIVQILNIFRIKMFILLKSNSKYILKK